MKFGTWLFSLISPGIARILSSVGFSIITITGMNEMLDQFKQTIAQSFSGMPADIFNVFLLAGGGTALGIITGALTTRLILWQTANATRILANQG